MNVTKSKHNFLLEGSVSLSFNRLVHFTAGQTAQEIRRYYSDGILLGRKLPFHKGNLTKKSELVAAGREDADNTQIQNVLFQDVYDGRVNKLENSMEACDQSVIEVFALTVILTFHIKDTKTFSLYVYVYMLFVAATLTNILSHLLFNVS